MTAANPATPAVQRPKPTPASIRAQLGGERLPPPCKPKKPFRPFLWNGRPTVLSREMIEEVARLMPTVLYLDTIGDYLGVHRTTWRKWLKRGKEIADRLAEDPDHLVNPNEELYVEFFYAYRRGLAEGEIRDLTKIAAGAPGWQASAWRLERRFPKRWGRKAPPDPAGPNGAGPPRGVVVYLPDNGRDAVRGAGAKGTGGPPAGNG
jgi:hypothetical protein